MDWILVGIGGAFGGVVRFQLGKAMSQRLNTTFPVGTFLINGTGALLLGVVTGMELPSSAYLLLGNGFLGAYTTFSTFMYEGFQLFEENERRNALTYLLGSLFLGVVGFFAGFAVGRLLNRF